MNAESTVRFMFGAQFAVNKSETTSKKLLLLLLLLTHVIDIITLLIPYLWILKRLNSFLGS